MTKKQKEVLNTVRRLTELKGYAPSVREISRELGLSSPSTVQTHLNRLEEQGCIKRDRRVMRSIRVVVDES